MHQDDASSPLEMEELAILNDQLDENYRSLMQECEGNVMEGEE